MSRFQYHTYKKMTTFQALTHIHTHKLLSTYQEEWQRGQEILVYCTYSMTTTAIDRLGFDTVLTHTFVCRRLRFCCFVADETQKKRRNQQTSLCAGSITNERRSKILTIKKSYLSTTNLTAEDHHHTTPKPTLSSWVCFHHYVIQSMDG